MAGSCYAGKEEQGGEHDNPRTMEASARLTPAKPKVYEIGYLPHADPVEEIAHSAPPNCMPTLNRNRLLEKGGLRYMTRRKAIPTKEASIRNMVWSGKSPKALPVLKVWVMRTGPCLGMDSPMKRVCRTTALVIWSRLKTRAMATSRSESLYQDIQPGESGLSCSASFATTPNRKEYQQRNLPSARPPPFRSCARSDRLQAQGVALRWS